MAACGRLVAGISATLLFTGAMWICTSGSASSGSQSDLIKTVLDGRARARGAIKSGKGRITRYVLSGMGRPGTNESRSVYDVAFSGNRFAIVCHGTVLRNDPDPNDKHEGRRTQPGSVHSTSWSYDGRAAVVYEPERQEAKRITRAASMQDIKSRFSRLTDVPFRGWLRREPPMRPPHADAGEPLRVVGHEVIDGSKCIVLEASWSVKESSGRTQSYGKRSWVDPSRGFVEPRFEMFVRNGGKRTTIWGCRTEYRRGTGGRWLPFRCVQRAYGYDQAAGTYTMRLKDTIEFSKGFRFNVPVSSKDLTLSMPSGTEIIDESSGGKTVVP